MQRYSNGWYSGLLGLNPFLAEKTDKNGKKFSYRKGESFMDRVFSLIPGYGRKFAVGLSHATGTGGFISFGGVPDPSGDPRFRFESNFTEAELVGPEKGHFMVTPNLVMFSQSSGIYDMAKKRDSYVLDTGSSAIVVPEAVLAQIITLITPRPEKIMGDWIVPCDAKLSEKFYFSVSFGNMQWVMPRDQMIMKDSQYNPKGWCSIAITDGADYILGAPFLEQFITLFDLDARKVFFHRRK
jgi:hypothetical protein